MLQTLVYVNMDHGHCGVIDDHTHDVDNDKSLPLLVKQQIPTKWWSISLLSNMMDGFVAEIRLWIR